MQPFLLMLPLALAIGVLAVAGASFVSFGGVWRNAGALFTLGSYSMLLGLLWLLPLLSQEAQGNDAFLNNWLAGQLSWLLGSIVVIGSLAGFGLRRWVVLLLAVANLVLGEVLLQVVILMSPPLLLALLALDMAALIALGVLLARRQQRWQIPAQGVLLAVSSLVVPALVYAVLGTSFHNGAGRVVGPPYLEGKVVIVSLALGLIIFLVERVWSTGQMLQRTT